MHLERTVVRSKAELSDLLRRWIAASDSLTIGDVGTFGGRWLVSLDAADGRPTVRLNADTKRSAVVEFLDHVARVGPEAPWRVLANRNGVVNRVEFTRDGPPTPGWYCYLDPPADAQGVI